MTLDKYQILLPTSLYRKLEENLPPSDSVSDYVTNVLEEVVKEEKPPYSEEEKRRIIRRLKMLGEIEDL